MNQLLCYTTSAIYTLSLLPRYLVRRCFSHEKKVPDIQQKNNTNSRVCPAVISLRFFCQPAKRDDVICFTGHSQVKAARRLYTLFFVRCVHARGYVPLTSALKLYIYVYDFFSVCDHSILMVKRPYDTLIMRMKKNHKPLLYYIVNLFAKNGLFFLLLCEHSLFMRPIG